MRGALARRRYDWHGFAQAISATMKPIFQKFSHSTPMFTVFPEASPNFYLGFSCGMRTAGVEMEGYAYRPSEELIQNLWKASTREEKESPPETRMLVQHYLETRGEPACFNELLIHVISSQTEQNTILEEIGQMVPFRPFDEPAGCRFGRDYRGPGWMT